MTSLPIKITIKETERRVAVTNTDPRPSKKGKMGNKTARKRKASDMDEQQPAGRMTAKSPRRGYRNYRKLRQEEQSAEFQTGTAPRPPAPSPYLTSLKSPRPVYSKYQQQQQVEQHPAAPAQMNITAGKVLQQGNGNTIVNSTIVQFVYKGKEFKREVVPSLTFGDLKNIMKLHKVVKDTQRVVFLDQEGAKIDSPVKVAQHLQKASGVILKDIPSSCASRILAGSTELTPPDCAIPEGWEHKSQWLAILDSNLAIDDLTEKEASPDRPFPWPLPQSQSIIFAITPTTQREVVRNMRPGLKSLSCPFAKARFEKAWPRYYNIVLEGQPIPKIHRLRKKGFKDTFPDFNTFTKHCGTDSNDFRDFCIVVESSWVAASLPSDFPPRMNVVFLTHNHFLLQRCQKGEKREELERLIHSHFGTTLLPTYSMASFFFLVLLPQLEAEKDTLAAENDTLQRKLTEAGL